MTLFLLYIAGYIVSYVYIIIVGLLNLKLATIEGDEFAQYEYFTGYALACSILWFFAIPLFTVVLLLKVISVIVKMVKLGDFFSQIYSKLLEFEMKLRKSI